VVAAKKAVPDGENSAVVFIEVRTGRRMVNLVV
jgi:hypothetical protein